MDVTFRPIALSSHILTTPRTPTPIDNLSLTLPSTLSCGLAVCSRSLVSSNRKHGPGEGVEHRRERGCLQGLCNRVVSEDPKRGNGKKKELFSTQIHLTFKRLMEIEKFRAP